MEVRSNTFGRLILERSSREHLIAPTGAFRCGACDDVMKRELIPLKTTGNTVFEGNHFCQPGVKSNTLCTQRSIAGSKL